MGDLELAEEYQVPGNMPPQLQQAGWQRCPGRKEAEQMEAQTEQKKKKLRLELQSGLHRVLALEGRVRDLSGLCGMRW